MIFTDALGQAHEVISRTGTQQGCVLGGKLYNIGTLSVVGATMEDHLDVYCPMFSDNILLVGRLSKIFAAADDLRGSLEEVGLKPQPAESAVYIPSYNAQNEPPPLLAALREQYPAFKDMPWLKDGITLLGCPVGTDAYVSDVLNKVCDNIAERTVHYAAVDDGLVHLQLHKFSVNAMLPYFLRTTSPSLTQQHAQRVDDLIWEALLDFSEVPSDDREDDALQAVFRDARCQIALPISQGGFGITPNECVSTPAFYSAVSKALRFAASCKFDPITTYITSPDFKHHPLMQAYEQARNDLIKWGAKEPEPEQPDSASQPALQQQRAPLAGDKGTAKKKDKHSPPVLPRIDSVLTHDSSQQLRFPDQRALTRLAQTAHPLWSAAGLTEESKARTKHLSKQTFNADSTSDETAAYLQSVGKFPKDSKIRHSPLAFIAHTESLVELFPRDLFAVTFAYLLGLPAPECLQTRDVDKCEGCDQHLDRFGHHRMSCNRTAAYTAAHTQLASAFAEVARSSGIQYTDKGVPTHLTNNKVGDALCNLSNGARRLVLDYTVAHPKMGTADDRWNTEALTKAVRNKWNRHGPQYAVIGFAFAACAMTTYGQMDAHLLRLLHILAKKRAELVHVYHRPLVKIETLFGRFFAQSRARLGAAVARGMAMRALGTSAMGVSKVFLRHIAPARFRDQNLSSGPHFSSGHAQWRYAIAA